MNPVLAAFLGSLLTVLLGSGGYWLAGITGIIKARTQHQQAQTADVVAKSQAELDKEKAFEEARNTLINQAIAVATATSSQMASSEQRQQQALSEMQEKIKILEEKVAKLLHEGTEKDRIIEQKNQLLDQKDIEINRLKATILDYQQGRLPQTKTQDTQP